MSEGEVVTCSEANEPSPGDESVEDEGKIARAEGDARVEDRWERKDVKKE